MGYESDMVLRNCVSGTGDGGCALSPEGKPMDDWIDIYVWLHEWGQQWLKREQEFVGVFLWVAGITTLSYCPEMGLTPVYPSVFIGLKIFAAFLWLIFGEQCVQRFKRRNTDRS
jgi:hypothetical protein